MLDDLTPMCRVLSITTCARASEFADLLNLALEHRDGYLSNRRARSSRAIFLKVTRVTILNAA